ncbi:hypothetical protein ACRALDRAFT_1065284 [Sodiomyces alcalophilus JCM 7366]|uniref:uncharacterized protein n=1 Tax=Sodiomyces alcalophilus JCM 7366 TaxID=591952 RepID=UPI0039B6A22E
MKITATAIALALLPATLASPVEKRQSATAIVDSYMFSISLPSFSTHRHNRNPSYLIWTTDGCTSSPDNPFGFPFIPACHRHDFGYHNFRAQSRFTSNNKLRIDNKFRDDLYYQCNTNGHGAVCRALADVYYAAVRAFGGSDANRAAADGRLKVPVDDQTQEEHDALVAIYEEKVAAYEAAVKEAEAKGELPLFA